MEDIWKRHFGNNKELNECRDTLKDAWKNTKIRDSRKHLRNVMEAFANISNPEEDPLKILSDIDDKVEENVSKLLEGLSQDEELDLADLESIHKANNSIAHVSELIAINKRAMTNELNKVKNYLRANKPAGVVMQPKKKQKKKPIAMVNIDHDNSMLLRLDVNGERNQNDRLIDQSREQLVTRPDENIDTHNGSSFLPNIDSLHIQSMNYTSVATGAPSAIEVQTENIPDRSPSVQMTSNRHLKSPDFAISSISSHFKTMNLNPMEEEGFGVPDREDIPRIGVEVTASGRFRARLIDTGLKSPERFRPIHPIIPFSQQPVNTTLSQNFSAEQFAQVQPFQRNDQIRESTPVPTSNIAFPDTIPEEVESNVENERRKLSTTDRNNAEVQSEENIALTPERNKLTSEQKPTQPTASPMKILRVKPCYVPEIATVVALLAFTEFQFNHRSASFDFELEFRAMLQSFRGDVALREQQKSVTPTPIQQIIADQNMPQLNIEEEPILPANTIAPEPTSEQLTVQMPPEEPPHVHVEDHSNVGVSLNAPTSLSVDNIQTRHIEDFNIEEQVRQGISVNDRSRDRGAESLLVQNQSANAPNLSQRQSLPPQSIVPDQAGSSEVDLFSHLNDTCRNRINALQLTRDQVETLRVLLLLRRETLDPIIIMATIEAHFKRNKLKIAKFLRYCIDLQCYKLLRIVFTENIGRIVGYELLIY